MDKNHIVGSVKRIKGLIKENRWQGRRRRQAAGWRNGL